MQALYNQSMSTLLLKQSDVRVLAKMPEVLGAVERAFTAHGKGESQMPAKVYLELPQYNGDFRAMPAYMSGSAGLKWVNSHAENPKRYNLPAVLAMYILSDPKTALPLAVMDATLITALRTGAAAGVASKFLARKDAKSIGFVGCGVQSHYALEAHRAALGKLEIVAADRNEDVAKAFATEVGGKAASVEEASACDIVVTTTPSHTPVVKKAWVKAGAHINAMGADAAGKQELETELVKAASVYLDDVEQASHSGEVNVPISKGEYKESDIAGTLGEVMVEKCQGRKGDEITIFDSTGLALQDLAVAQMVYDSAKEKGIGTEIDFLS